MNIENVNKNTNVKDYPVKFGGGGVNLTDEINVDKSPNPKKLSIKLGNKEGF